MTEITRDIGRIEGKLDLLIDRVAKFTDEQDKLAVRVNFLEKEHEKTKTTLTLVGSTVAVAAGIFGALIERMFFR